MRCLFCLWGVPRVTRTLGKANSHFDLYPHGVEDHTTMLRWLLIGAPIQLVSEASLPPLQVTLTHSTLPSYEEVLCLLTSFPISRLARHGVKPRLCRSSWRAFASTHPLMFPSTSPRDALLACPLSPSWKLPSFIVESTLSSPCSLSDLFLLPRCIFLHFSCQGALHFSCQKHFSCQALAHLDSLLPHDLVLWTDRSVSSSFGKGNSCILANCSLCGAEATLSFYAGPVCSSFSVEACTILQALCWFWQHQQVCHFSLTLALSSPLSRLICVSFYLNLSCRSGRNCLLSPPVP